jgi:hypothetical protein
MELHHRSCCDGQGDGDCALPPEFARLRYFFGQRLGVVDFADEQGYHVGKRRFHNWQAHGAGVLCGLAAERFVFPQGAPPATPTSILRVRAGAALDGCGRELVVGVDQCVDVDAWFQKHKDLPDVKAWFEDDDLPRRLWVALRYRECPTDPAPAPRDPCGCETEGCDFGRVRESFEMALLTESQRACLTEVFPSRDDLQAAAGAPDVSRALGALVAAGCLNPIPDAWLCLASVDLTIVDVPARKVVDLTAPDNAIPERITLLGTAALQQLLGGALTAGSGDLGDGPRLGEPTFAGDGPDGGTLTIPVRLHDDGSGPTPLAAATFDPAAVEVRLYDDVARNWSSMQAPASITYQDTPPRVDLVWNAGALQPGLYRLSVAPSVRTPPVDERMRPLRASRWSRHFRLAVTAGTLSLAPSLF